MTRKKPHLSFRQATKEDRRLYLDGSISDYRPLVNGKLLWALDFLFPEEAKLPVAERSAIYLIAVKLDHWKDSLMQQSFNQPRT